MDAVTTTSAYETTVDGIGPRRFDQARAEAAVRELLLACGEDPDRAGLKDTPHRVAKAYRELFAGLYADPDAVLARTFDESHEVAPGVLAWRTGGHTPGHSVVRLTSGDARLTFAGDAIFPVGFDHPDWHNGFEHDPEESVRVRVRLLREAAATGELLVATHLPFPSVGRVAADGDSFRWVAGFWDY